MANLKISQMPLTNEVKDNDIIPIVQDGVNKSLKIKTMLSNNDFLRVPPTDSQTGYLVVHTKIPYIDLYTFDFDITIHDVSHNEKNSGIWKFNVGTDKNGVYLGANARQVMPQGFMHSDNFKIGMYDNNGFYSFVLGSVDDFWYYPFVTLSNITVYHGENTKVEISLNEFSIEWTLTPQTTFWIAPNLYPLVFKNSIPEIDINPLKDVLSYDSNGELVWTSANSFKTSLTRTEATGLSILVTGGQSYNILQAPLVEIINEDNLVFAYDGIGNNKVVKFPYVADRVDVMVKLRLTGTIGGSSRTQRTWQYEVRRSNDIMLESKQTFKFDGTSIDRQTIDFESYMRGSDDPFITDGLKLMLNNLSTETITINTIQITTRLSY